MSRIDTYVGVRKTRLVSRLIGYLAVLRGAHMTPGDIAHHGYEYALAMLYEAADQWLVAGQDISCGEQLEIREQAANLLALATWQSDQEAAHRDANTKVGEQ